MDKVYLVTSAQKALEKIPIQLIYSYANKLNKHQRSSRLPVDDLIKSICIFLSKKDKKQLANDKIKKVLMEKAYQFGQIFSKALDKFMDDKYIDSLKKNVQEIAESTLSNMANDKEKQENRLQSKNKPIISNVNNKNPSLFQSKLSKKTKNVESIKLSNAQFQNLYPCSPCICQFQVEEDLKKCYVCQLCDRYFHRDCIKVLHAQMKVCVFCHLRNLSPMNQVISTIFQGKLKKQQKIHEIIFDIKPQILQSSTHLIQIRSLRLKQCATSSILFPDYTKVSCNNYDLRQFVPLIRQSSLKYRKDNSFYLRKTECRQKGNRIVIETKVNNKMNKDQRIQPQDHLIGVYLIEEKTILHKFDKIKHVSLNTFEQSAKLLNRALGQQQDILVQLIKIPLTCIFTGEQIKIPVRGTFCEHFQCFDLYNYLIFTAKSQHPRWNCPLCKSPTYIFKIDCLLFAIINQKIIESATQILFFPNSNYTIFNKQGIVGLQNNKISDLNIETICKRQLIKSEEDKGRKKRQKETLNMDQQKIICLQSD